MVISLDLDVVNSLKSSSEYILLDSREILMCHCSFYAYNLIVYVCVSVRACVRACARERVCVCVCVCVSGPHLRKPLKVSN